VVKVVFKKWRSCGVTYMASAKREPIAGVWGWSPQWVSGANPLVRVPGAKLT